MKQFEWVGTLPHPWETKPLRATVDYVVSNVDKVPADNEVPVRLCNYTDVYNNEFITLDLDFMQATATEAEIAKFGIAVDDVIITKDSESWDDIGVPALVKETASDLVCGYHLALLRPRKKLIAGSFLFRCLQAKSVGVQLELAANGVTRFGIPKSEIGAMVLPVPPLPQQHAIADYLDRETTRIDALIAGKERLLGLLAEKRRALITRAVTRGLDPDIPLRDSSIPWLGNIPAHWDKAQLKRFMKFITSGSRGWAEHYSDTGAIFLRIGNLTRHSVQLDLSDIQYVEPPEGVEGARTRVQVDDLLFSITAYLGSIAFVSENIGEAYVNQHIALVRLKRSQGLIPEYVAYAVLSDSGQIQLKAQSYGGTKTQLALDNIRELWFPVPPVNEQVAITGYIRRVTSKIHKLHSATERTIALLKERRAALIAAAVTGQIDVGGNS